MNKLLYGTAITLLCMPGMALAAEKTPVKAGTNTEVVSAVEDSTGAAMGVVSAEMTTTAKGFVEAAAQSDMYEVKAGQIAEERSKSAKIKAFAKEMVAAHTATTAKVKAILAANPKLNIAPPAKLDSRHQSLIDNLTGAKAEDFDVRYLNQQVNAHQEALILMRGYAKDGDNAALKKFANATRPAVEQHLNHAKMLDKNDEDMKAAKKQ